MPSQIINIPINDKIKGNIKESLNTIDERWYKYPYTPSTPNTIKTLLLNKTEITIRKRFMQQYKNLFNSESEYIRLNPPQKHIIPNR
jgi:hypothetical protein